MNTTHIPALDVVIIGGGIAGLWALASLRQQGYSALLVEKSALGAKQTLASQGIIHGGTKYALTGHLSGAAQAIAEMPKRWHDALGGKGLVDLRQANVLSSQQYLWTTHAIGSKLTAFFAGKAMRNRMNRLKSDKLPAFLPADFQGHCYALAEPVVDIVSVLQCFVRQYQHCIITEAHWQREGDYLIVNGQRYLPEKWVYTAGENNQSLSHAQQQIRPLHMMALRVPADAPAIYGHCLGMSEQPKITITTHPFNWQQPDGEKVYWLGGEPAEKGVNLNSSEQIAQVQCLLKQSLPHLNKDWLDDTQRYISVPINRAEGANHGKRPDLPVIKLQGNTLSIWATKLAFAPWIADNLISYLSPPKHPQPLISDSPVSIAPYPWYHSN